MEAKEKKEYEDRISALDAQVKEFQEKERLATEANQKAEADAKAATEKAAFEAKQAEIKAFCDTAIKENRMTPAMRQKDEPIMFELSKTNVDALKSFQEKYALPIVPLGEVAGLNAPPPTDPRPEIMVKAEKYAKAHGTEKEFSDCQTQQDKINRAVYLLKMDPKKMEDDKK